MSGFSAEWLARREPVDQRARNQAILSAVAERFAGLPSVSVVDLACGTGATMRALAPRLPPRQCWRLIDNDLSLLARAPVSAAPVAPGATARAIPLDLARDLEAALDGPLDLVTTTAFLDLVSAEWLERLATEAAARGLPFYSALSFDGRIAFDPKDETDDAVVEAFRRHQCTDKGFGPALGPAAAAAAIALFERIGYAVTSGPADWALKPADDLQDALIAGYAAAAAEVRGLDRERIAGWLTRRRIMRAAQRASLRVGHVDFFAWPGQNGRR